LLLFQLDYLAVLPVVIFRWLSIQSIKRCRMEDSTQPS